MNNDRPLRTVKSFIRREGRLTNSQRCALQRLWPSYGIDFDKGSTSCLDFHKLFARTAPVVLEIGFGNGVSLAKMAADAPELNFLGVEVHRPGVGSLLKQIEAQQLTNIRIICDDAVNVLEQLISTDSLYRVQLYFPDPWPKKKHHKRRIVQKPFLKLLASRLEVNGILHMATDWQHYAQYMAKLMQANRHFQSLSDTAFSERPSFRPLTKFEQRGLNLGHGVWDLIYRRV